MIKLFGVIGAVVGFAISVLFTEVLFHRDAEWPIAINGGLTVLGWLIGTSVARRRIARSN